MKIYWPIRWVSNILNNSRVFQQLIHFLVTFSQNISIAVVGKNEKFHILDDSENTYYVAAAEKRPPGPPPGPDDAGPGSSEQPSIDDAADKKEDKGPGDPQVQVAMET